MRNKNTSFIFKKQLIWEKSYLTDYFSISLLGFATCIFRFIPPFLTFTQIKFAFDMLKIDLIY